MRHTLWSNLWPMLVSRWNAQSFTPPLCICKGSLAWDRHKYPHFYSSRYNCTTVDHTIITISRNSTQQFRHTSRGPYYLMVHLVPSEPNPLWRQDPKPHWHYSNFPIFVEQVHPSPLGCTLANQGSPPKAPRLWTNPQGLATPYHHNRDILQDWQKTRHCFHGKTQIGPIHFCRKSYY